tara:strand:+ start:2984 stop:3241 length:258 start_codon:yes stop_codon:yes gene_type:complete
MPNVVKNLSAPAQLMLVSALVLVVHRTVVKFSLVHLVGTLLSVALMVYNNNCLVAGKCSAWAWVVAGLYVVGAVLSVVAPPKEEQ